MSGIVELESIWQEYGMDQLEEGLATLFPEYDLSLNELLEKVIA